MTGRIIGHGDKTKYMLGNREVTKEEFDQAFPDKPIGNGQGLTSFKPLASDALAVHPSQVSEATEDAKRKGVPTEFMPDGRPVFKSSRHFRDYARQYGFRHKGY